MLLALLLGGGWWWMQQQAASERPQFRTAVLERGDRLLLVTDGVHEQRSGEGEQFGIERVVGVLGAFFGGWLLPKLGLSFGGDMGLFITAFIGAILLLAIIGLIKKA